MKQLFAVGLIALVSACATAMSTPQDMDPLGIYDFTTTVQGQEVQGTFRVENSNTQVMGSIMASGMPAMPILSVSVEGDWMTIRANTGSNPIELDLVFVGNDFTGEWKAYDTDGTVADSGAIAGRRRTGGRASGS